ncbi:hypothetical protein ACKC9G_06805 [Pokkaliibacter sp. CJK22405]|uniref:hypothetical protein n=1 Tax=Pokkaliibacter sp. CJK22405 TaxID=3384615 RepID=UPI0039853CFA
MTRQKKARGTHRVEREKTTKKEGVKAPRRRDADPEQKKVFKQRWLEKHKRVKSVYQKAVDEADADKDKKEQSQVLGARQQRVLENLARLGRGDRMLPVNQQPLNAPKPKQINKPKETVVVPIELPFPGADKDQRLMSILKRMNAGKAISEDELAYFDDVILAHEGEVSWVDEGDENDSSDDLWDAFERGNRR